MIWILGANGQVGSALSQLLGSQALAFDRKKVDLGQPDSLEATLDALLKSDGKGIPPQALINAAAYTQVDRAEQETELAQAVNGRSPGILAQWCLKHGIPLVHYSTDYVFPGTGERPWTEEDVTSPLNAYGASKLAGEKEIARIMNPAAGKWLVFRTSWVYDATGKNFLRTMLRLGHDREELKVVADQFGAPTYAPHLAQATLEALENAQKAKSFPSGIYHFCNTGATTWHGFAERIFSEAAKRGVPRNAPLKVKRVLPIRSEEFPTPAERPRNSRMNTDKAFQNLGVRLPDWQIGLDQCLGLIE